MDILNKDKVTFKDIEQEIYAYHCQKAREDTIRILSLLDEELHGSRNKSEYRDKGLRQTTIKTVYGEVEYSRHVYITKDEDGKNVSEFLLDKELGMDTIGQISTNLAEKIVQAVTDTAFRKAADMITQTTGQSISHSGVWNVVQVLGERLGEEEGQYVQEMRAEQPRGTREIPVLFEEMDGIWLKSQRKDAGKAPGIEVKIGTMYEGWRIGTGKRSTLAGKTVYACVDSGEVFHEKWEAKIQSIYDPEKIGLRVLNGDGGSWIRDGYEADAIRQLDRFHVTKAIRQKTSHGEARRMMLRLLREEKTEELVEYGQIYYDSICTKEGDTPEEKDAEELRDYLRNHREELSRYTNRGKKIPAAPEGITYRTMGVQENQNCTVIGLRMKGKRRRWAPESANNMIRILCSRENKELADAIERHTDGEVWLEPIKAKAKETTSSSKVPEADGKGRNRYAEVINVHMPILDSENTRTVKVFKRLTH